MSFSVLIPLWILAGVIGWCIALWIGDENYISCTEIFMLLLCLILGPVALIVAGFCSLLVFMIWLDENCTWSIKNPFN